MGKTSAVLLTTYLYCCLFCAQFADSRKFNSKRNDDNGEACNSGFLCPSGKCIALKQRCNGMRWECENNEDEQNCDSCSGDAFYCPEAKQCLPGSWQCDGYPDCSLGEDEIGCHSCSEGTFHCPSDAKCIYGHWRCDSVRDCTSGEDEDACPCEFKCEADDGCLNEKKICDNYPDCSDGQDEDGCPCSGFICNNKQCVPDISFGDARCDGVPSCNDRSDEKNCDLCKNDAFYCSTERRCVRSSWQCDGKFDCASGEDESGCSSHKNRPIVMNADETEN